MFFSGGGVTFTGGECTLQNKALAAVIKGLRENDISVAVESNASTNSYLQIARLCDYVITDYKHPDKDKLKSVTGGNLSVIEKNILNIAKEKIIHLRVPLIHGFNDSDEDFSMFLNFFEKVKKVSADFDLEILTYHEYGKEKWKKLGLEYKIINGKVSDERVKIFKEKLLFGGINLIKT